jgi:glycerol uptake facilitator-like aquaporin
MENQRRFADSKRRVGVAELVSALVILAVVASVLAVPVAAMSAAVAGTVGIAVGYGIASLRQSRARSVRTTTKRTDVRCC